MRVGYLTDDLGRPSSVRLFGLICVVSGIMMAFMSIALGSREGAALAAWLVGVGIAGKVTQRRIEDVSRGTST